MVSEGSGSNEPNEVNRIESKDQSLTNEPAAHSDAASDDEASDHETISRSSREGSGEPMIDPYGVAATPVKTDSKAKIIQDEEGSIADQQLLRPQSKNGNSPTVQFSNANYSVNKDETASALIAVTLAGRTTDRASVTYRTDSGKGYLPVSGTLIFEPGQTRQTFAVSTDSSLPEAAAYVDLALGDPVGATLGDPNTSSLSFLPADDYEKLYPRRFFVPIFSDPKTGRVIRHILLAVILILGFYFMGDFVLHKGEAHSAEWAKHLQPQTTSLQFNDTLVHFSPEERLRLTSQLDEIRERIKLHLDVMNFYYTRYYMAIITSSLAAALAAVAIILISKGGWQQTSNYIISTFFVAAAASVFYGAFPGMFQQQQNITDNKILYLKYVALENELLSYVVTGEALNNNVTAEELKRTVLNSTAAETSAKVGKAAANSKAPESEPKKSKTGIQLNPSEFIHYIDQQLAQDNIAIGFDYGQTPNYKNAFSTK